MLDTSFALRVLLSYLSSILLLYYSALCLYLWASDCPVLRRSHESTDLRIVGLVLGPTLRIQDNRYNPAWYHLSCNSNCRPVSFIYSGPYSKVAVVSTAVSIPSIGTLSQRSVVRVQLHNASSFATARPDPSSISNSLGASTMFTFTLANTAVACVAVYFTFTTTVSWIRRRRISRAHGCEAPTRLPQAERIIGLGLFKEMQAQTKSKTLLPSTLEQHRELGNTFSGVLLGQGLLITIEPENIKAVLATQFHDFGIGTRYRGMGALLGHGIFSSDGSRWEHSRV